MARHRFMAEDDEEVLLETGPHWVRLVPRLALPTLVLAGGVAGFLAWSSAPVWFAWVVLTAFVVALVLGGVRVATWRANTFVVTTARVVHRQGLVRRTGREIPIRRVQDVTYHQGLVERLAGVGRVRVESAGAASAEEVPDLPRPAEVQRVVNRALDAALRAGARAGPDLADQLDRLDALRRRGVLTDAEFARKKEELLQRR